ncbi:hypothetical protein D3C78_1635800 [compost metagenome]
MLDHNEKLKLVIEYINAGAKDAEIIIHNINKIETKLFNSNPSSNLTKNGRKLQKKGLLRSKNLNKE